MLGQSIVVIARHDRLIDMSPCSDIDRRVLIRIRNVATGDTLKTGLGFAIGFFSMPTGRALARGIAGINILNGNAYPLRFVLDKRLKLKERPTAVLSPVGFPYRGPFADVFKLFQLDPAPGVFGFLDELPGNIDSYQDVRLVFQLIDFLIYGTCAFRHSRVCGNPVAC